jgi:prephenate dehydratase
MAISLAHLGPSGTNAETAALAYADWLLEQKNQQALLCPYPTIAQTGQAVAEGKADLAVVPVENSTEGSVAVTLDLLWQYDQLQIQQELVLPIAHALLSHSPSRQEIKIIYSHPQALAQCQKWLERTLPSVPLVASNSTAEAVRQVMQDPTAGAIAAPRTAKLYGVPILAEGIQDYPENCTRFWIVGLTPTQVGERLSLAFSVPANVPGSLVKPLQAFAKRGINLSRIESRPTKRSLGEYLFFVDLQGNMSQPAVQAALTELASQTEILKIFGNYSLLPISA